MACSVGIYVSFCRQVRRLSLLKGERSMERSKQVARAVQAAPRDIVRWLKANQQTIVQYGTSQGFVFAFTEDECWDIGRLAVTGQLTLRGE